MVIGPTFAYGHLGKTGGDAVHAWFSALARPEIAVDDVTQPAKHDPFNRREAAAGKQHYAVGIRRLPNWTLSLLHEWAHSEPVWPGHGWSSASDVLDPQNALKFSFADGMINKMIQGVNVTHWLRMEYLLEDFVGFANQVFPLTPEEQCRIRSTPTKPPRPYERDVTQWWSIKEISQMYALNPAWAALERAAYPI